MIKIENLVFKYSKNGPQILDNISLDLETGKIGVLLGKNGSGKTTLLKNLLSLEKPLNGKILINGKNICEMKLKEKSKFISYVPQEMEFGNLTVFDTILTGLISSFNFFPSKKNKEDVQKIINEMNLENIQNKLLNELSGGEKQKVAIARALVKNPELLILDEPTSNLDIENEIHILKEIKQLSKNKKITALLAIHDLNTALNFGDIFFFLKKGKIVNQGSIKIVDEKLIKNVFNINCKIKTLNGRKIVIVENEK